MPQVSQKKIQKDILLRIHKQLFDIMLDLQNTQRGNAFINELLTDTEKIMLAKRLAVLIMLYEDIPHSAIAKLLGMTRATVWKYAKQIDKGEFQHIQYIFRKKKDREELWKTLCKLSRGGLPPYSGRGRWSYLHKMTKSVSQ